MANLSPRQHAPCGSVSEGVPVDFLNDIQLDEHPLPYDLSRINILMTFDQFAASLCGEIRATRGIQDEEPAR